MFSVDQKRKIADEVQQILRATNHAELPAGEIHFLLHVDGSEPELGGYQEQRGCRESWREPLERRTREAIPRIKENAMDEWAVTARATADARRNRVRIWQGWLDMGLGACGEPLTVIAKQELPRMIKELHEAACEWELIAQDIR